MQARFSNDQFDYLAPYINFAMHLHMETKNIQNAVRLTENMA